MATAIVFRGAVHFFGIAVAERTSLGSCLRRGDGESSVIVASTYLRVLCASAVKKSSSPQFTPNPPIASKSTSRIKHWFAADLQSLGAAVRVAAAVDEVDEGAA
jgi:hypothetical protein